MQNDTKHARKCNSFSSTVDLSYTDYVYFMQI